MTPMTLDDSWPAVSADWQPGPTPVFGMPLAAEDATALEDDLRILRAACRGEWRGPDVSDRVAQIRAALGAIRR